MMQSDVVHYLHMSPNTSHYVEAVFSMVRKVYGKQLGDPMGDLNVNLVIWAMFMNCTLRAAVHLGKDYDTNLHYAKNHLWDSLGQLFCDIIIPICEKVRNLWSRNTGDRCFENN